MQDIAQALDAASFFGLFSVSDLQTVESEKQEKDKKMKLKKEKSLEEMRIAEKKIKQQEEEDYIFAMKEQERLNALHRLNCSVETREHKMQDIAQALDAANLFGLFNVSDLQTVESEKQEKDKKMKFEKEKRLEEMRIAEKKIKQQEEEDYLFAMKEQERLNALHRLPPKTFGRGRGTTIMGLLESSPSLPTFSQGRGKFARQSRNKGSSFNRDILLADQITRMAGGEGVYRNSLQERYWQGDSSVNYTLKDDAVCNQDEAAGGCSGKFSPNTLQNQDNLPFDTFKNKDPDGVYAVQQPDYNSLHPDLTTNFDDFEDAVSSSSTYTSVKQDMSPFESASSSGRASPVPPPTVACGRLFRKPPRSRLAAKFSNPMSTTPVKDSVSHYDFFADSLPQKQPKTPSRNSGIPFNSVNASQRVLNGGGEVRPVDLYVNYKLYHGNSGEFHLNHDEFPPL